MKMTKESYNNILKTFEANIGRIQEYASNLKEHGKYQDFGKRLAWDCLRAFIGVDVICDIYYGIEGLNDDHITTAGKKALRDLKIL